MGIGTGFSGVTGGCGVANGSDERVDSWKERVYFATRSDGGEGGENYPKLRNRSLAQISGFPSEFSRFISVLDDGFERPGCR